MTIFKEGQAPLQPFRRTLPAAPTVITGLYLGGAGVGWLVGGVYGVIVAVGGVRMWQQCQA